MEPGERRNAQSGAGGGLIQSDDRGWRGSSLALPPMLDCKTWPPRFSRNGETCWKCGAETFVPHADWEEPALPPVDRIRELAREVGYAIGEHGSKERDLDLIAVPWSESAVGNHDLIQHIAQGLGARIVEIERKPLGRYAATIQMNGWYKNLDLSVCPMVTPNACDQLPQHSGRKPAVLRSAASDGWASGSPHSPEVHAIDSLKQISPWCSRGRKGRQVEALLYRLVSAGF